uniref:Uncharacterized protein n=1 Tax=Knipowitschia caucasica TaxID=637954 RepID=A0AAV2MHI3_KNICA
MCLTEPQDQDPEDVAGGSVCNHMWLVAVCALVPASLLLSHHYRDQAVSLWRRAQAWTLWLGTGQVRPQSLHAFVFSQCTHGRVDSVLRTFDLYHSKFPSLSIGATAGGWITV